MSFLTFTHSVSRAVFNGGFAQKVPVPQTLANTNLAPGATGSVATYSNQNASYNSTLHAALVPIVFGTTAYSVYLPLNAVITEFDLGVTTAFSGGTSGGSIEIGSGLPISVAADPTIANVGTAGSTTYTYRVAAVSGGGLAVSASVSTTTGNAALSASNYNTITEGTAVVGTQYNIYRTVGGATQGLIGSVVAASTSFVFSDTGLAATGTSPTAASNTTGADLLASVLISSFVTAGAENSLSPIIPQSLVSDGQTIFVTITGSPTAGAGFLSTIYLNPPVIQYGLKD